jgi:signal transduction histidine kinase
MSLFVVLPGILGFFLSLAIAIYILRLDPRAPANRLFAALTFLQALWMFCGVRVQLATDPAGAAFWHRLTFFWPVTVALGYHLGLRLTNQHEKSFHRLSMVINYVTAAGFAMVGWYEQSLLGALEARPWGWEYAVDWTFHYYVMSVVWKYMVFLVIVVYCSVYALRVRNPYHRDRTLTYLAGYVFPTVFASVTRALFPLFGFPSPPLSNVAMVVGTILIALSIQRSRAFMISPALAARTVFDSVQDGIVLLDEEFAVLEANTGASLLVGRPIPAMVGAGISEILPGAVPPPGDGTLTAVDIDREVVLGEKHLGYRITPMVYRGYAFGAVCVIKDLSRRAAWERERQEMREQLFQKQKLESIGTLAGGIAHDFNNALGGVLLAAENLRAVNDSGDQVAARSLDTIIDAATHAEDLTRRLLEFARKDQEAYGPVNLREVLEKVESLCQHTFGSLVTLAFDYQIDGPRRSATVRGNAQALQSVFLNLCINARDALGGKGTIFVSLEVLGQDRTQARSRVQGLEAPATARVCVRDEGVGMDETVKARIFDPFFTTKGVGEGTGLGLSSAYGTIRAHDGRIEVESEPGKGSTFCVYLPLAE